MTLPVKKALSGVKTFEHKSGRKRCLLLCQWQKNDQSQLARQPDEDLITI